jgi:uncharacterized protein with NRDE domain
MCTLVMLVGVHADYPVLVAANRDEFYARDATGPALLLEDTRAVGGRDLRARGTWMGTNAHGLFVGLTNQRTWQPPVDGRRSRGDVPLGVLACRTVDEAHAFVRSLDAREFNDFNLVYGDARGLRCAYARGDSAALRFEDVPPGAHVLPNDALDAPSFAKVARARALLAAHALPAAQRRAPLDELVSPLRAVLASHERAPLDAMDAPPPGALFTRELARELDALCVHTPIYGTRSATLLALAPAGVAHYLFASGPPCTTPFEDFTALLHG